MADDYAARDEDMATYPTGIGSIGGSYDEDDFKLFVSDASFPGTRDEIVDFALDKGAPAEFIDRLSRIPDREYKDWYEVFDSF